MDGHGTSYEIAKHAILFIDMPQHSLQHRWPQSPHNQLIKLMLENVLSSMLLHFVN